MDGAVGCIREEGSDEKLAEQKRRKHSGFNGEERKYLYQFHVQLFVQSVETVRWPTPDVLPCQSKLSLTLYEYFTLMF